MFKYIYIYISVYIYMPVRISINGVLLKEVDHFVYLSGVISNDGSLDKEISTRRKNASIAFGRLW